MMYRKVKHSLIDYSTDILPVILDEQVLNNKETESVANFAEQVLNLIKESKMIEPIEIIFPIVRNKRRFKAELSSVIEILVEYCKYDLLLTNANFCLGIFNDASLSDSL